MGWVEETRPALHKPLIGTNDALINKAVMALSEYLYRALIPSDPHEGAASISLWREGIINGIIVEQATQGKSVCPSVDIDVNAEDSLPIETVKSAIHMDEPVNRHELLALLVAEEISYEQYTEEINRTHEPIGGGPMYAKDRRWRDRLSTESSTDG
jgi:hypothetical protein